MAFATLLPGSGRHFIACTGCPALCASAGIRRTFRTGRGHSSASAARGFPDGTGVPTITRVAPPLAPLSRPTPSRKIRFLVTAHIQRYNSREQKEDGWNILDPAGESKMEVPDWVKVRRLSRQGSEVDT